MINSLLNALFGCSHQRTTFPITPARRATYVACLDCGKEFDYNWKEMRRIDRAASPVHATSVPVVNH
jgi:hypothetical protein